MTTMKALLTSAVLASCASDAQGPADQGALRDECGEPPAEPAFALTAPYPPSAPACMPADQYAARDAWITDLRDYSDCAARYACRQLGGSGSPDGCTK